jgi:hypothetical protein
MGHLFAGARGLVIEKRRPGVEDGKCAVRPRSPEGIATPCRYQSESSNLMQHCILADSAGLLVQTRLNLWDHPYPIGGPHFGARSRRRVSNRRPVGRKQPHIADPCATEPAPEATAHQFDGRRRQRDCKTVCIVPNRPYAEYRKPTLRTAVPPANTSVATGKCSMSRSPQRRSKVRADHRRLLHIPGKGHHGGNNRENCSNVERNEIQR